MRETLMLLGIVAVVLAGAGCEAPVVTIEHALPAAVPIDEAANFPAGPVTATGDVDTDLSAFATEALRERLDDAALLPAVDQSWLGPEAGGAIVVTVEDTLAKRQLRHWNPQTDDTREQTVESLIRRVDVAAAFTLTTSGSADGPVVIEINRAYDSRGDPQTWGELGLRRPDDPAQVPAAEEITRGLVVQCVDGFVEMIRPLSIRVDVPMRYAGPKAALDAAGEGRFGDALTSFREALNERPDDVNLLFNAAVAAEAADDLPAALASYQQIVELTDGDDAEAVDGVERIGLVIDHRQRP